MEKNIFITDSKGIIHPVLYLVNSSEDLSIIKLIPAKDYSKGEMYTLWIKDIKAKNGSTLAKWTSMDFTIEK